MRTRGDGKHVTIHTEDDISLEEFRTGEKCLGKIRRAELDNNGMTHMWKMFMCILRWERKIMDFHARDALETLDKDLIVGNGCIQR